MDAPPLSRRDFLGRAAGFSAAASTAAFACRPSPPPAVSRGTDPTALSATAAVAAMRAGEITAEAYAIALLDRAERLQRLNAFRAIDRDLALAGARAADKARASGARLGLLHGLPIPVKDSVNTTAYPTTNGTRLLEQFRPRADAAVLGPLLAQGAHVMGKTNLHELSLGFTSTNPHFGAVRNPYNEQHVPGGSSGGSAAAVAARMAPLAIAEDTAGSIRCPASWCGITGLRPTFGRYPNGGIMTLTDDKFDQVGAVARTVEDLVLFDSVVTGEASSVSAAPLKGVRLGVADQLMTNLHPDVERVTAEAFERLQAQGAAVVRVDMPEVSRLVEIGGAIITFERGQAITRFLAAENTGVTYDQLMAAAGDDIKGMPPVTPAAYAAALEARAALQATVRARFAEHRIAALAYPTTFGFAPTIGDPPTVTWQGQPVPRVVAILRSTLLAPCCGHPGLVLPAGLSADGLPIGLELDGPANADRQLLALGLACESVLGAIPAPSV